MSGDRNPQGGRTRCRLIPPRAPRPVQGPLIRPGEARPVLLGLLILCALPAAGGADAPADPVTTATRLIDEGAPAGAEAILLQAVQDAPEDLAIYKALGGLYESTDRLAEALEVYGHALLRVEPEDAGLWARFKRLFYADRFPRELQFQYLNLAPITFTVDRCIMSGDQAGGPVGERRLAYTTALLYPPELRRGGTAPWVRLPWSLGDRGNLMYNRVVYGMLSDPGTQVLRTRWMAGYPSGTILLSGADHSVLAQRLLHVLLRGHLYMQDYLGLDRPGEGDDLLRLFLTEEGPTGAEQMGDAIFFYDVTTDRAPLEWMRQAFHELGHLLLPRVGPFEGDDPWGNGDLGERLLFQWLLEEAGAVTESRWPDAAAQEALNSLWDVGHLPAQAFLVENCRIPVAAWLATDPEQFEGMDGAARFAGFCMWVQAAHGRRLLATVLGTAQDPAPGAFMEAYRRVVAETLQEGHLWLDAGALNLIASTLAQTPLEGALGRELVVLDQGGHATIRAYLPAGHWAVRPVLDAAPGPAMRLILNGETELDVSPEGVADLGELEAGWVDLTVACDGMGPVEFLGLRVEKAGR